MPEGKSDKAPNFIELNYHDQASQPQANHPYKVVFEDGTIKEGYLDGAGHARIEATPNQAAKVYFGESPDPFQAQAISLLSVDDDALHEDLRKLGLNPDTADLQALVDKESGRGA